MVRQAGLGGLAICAVALARHLFLDPSVVIRGHAPNGLVAVAIGFAVAAVIDARR